MLYIDHLLFKGIILKGDQYGVSVPTLIYGCGNVIVYYCGYFNRVYIWYMLKIVYEEFGAGVCLWFTCPYMCRFFPSWAMTCKESRCYRIDVWIWTHVGLSYDTMAMKYMESLRYQPMLCMALQVCIIYLSWMHMSRNVVHWMFGRWTQ